MKRFGHLCLIVVLALTGLSLGAARGQVRVGGDVVLCIGGTVAVVSVDMNGAPVNKAMVCPDMALSLLQAVAMPVAVPPRAVPRVERIAMDPAWQSGGFGLRARQGRGPPA